MEDIKKAIEEERNEAYNNASNRCPYEGHEYHVYRSGYDSGIDRGIEIVLSKWEESTRWRKVEEELPEVKEEEYFILCKMDSSQKYSIVLVHCEIDFKRYFRVVNITEWKPINK